MKRLAATILAGVVAAGVGGCLPEGGPGIGERVLEARGLSGLVSGVGDNKPLLFTRWIGGEAYAGRPSQVLDLYHVAPGQQAAQRVQEDVVTPLQFDALGRLYLLYGWAMDQVEARKVNSPYQVMHQLRRVDLAAGTATELGWVHEQVSSVGRPVSLWASPETTHMVVHLPGDRWLTRTLDDRAREISTGPTSRSLFAGEDVCVLDDHRLFCVLVESGVPFRLTSRQVLNFIPLHLGAGAPEIAVVVADMAARAAGVEEATQVWLVRLREAPGQPREYLLAGGRKLLVEDVAGGGSQAAALEADAAGAVRLRLLTFTPGSPPAAQELRLPAVAGPPDPEGRLPWSPPRIRPGRSEAWVLATDGQLAILRADGSHQFLRVAPDDGTAPDASTFLAQIIWTADELAFEKMIGALPSVRRELFTTDGRWWVYRRGGVIHLADADDPGAPSRLQIPVTAFRGVAEILGQGRLLLFASFGYTDQVNVWLHDRDTLAPLGALDDVRRVVVGRRGMLALVTGRPISDMSSLSPGKLVLATTDGTAPGPVELLADNVTQFAIITGCAGCDPLKAGNRLAYLVHARVPWRYDGLWMADLP